MRRLAPVFLVASLACSGSQKKGSDEIEQDPITFEDPEGADAGAAAGHLTIVPMVLTDGQNEIHLRENGTVEAGGQQFFTLNDKGEVLAANGGLYATLKADGTIAASHLPAEKFEGITITDTGSIEKDGTAEVTITEDGRLQKGEVPFLKLEGPAEGYKAATLAYVMLAVLTNQPIIPAIEAPAKPEGTEGDGTDGSEGDGGEGDENPCGG